MRTECELQPSFNQRHIQKFANSRHRFQYISCQLEALQNLPSAPFVREELHRLPMGLDATYERLLLSLNEKFRPQIVSLLKWLTSSSRDLRLEELAEIFILRPEREVVFDKTYRLFKPTDLIKYMSNLIVAKKGSGQTTRSAESHTHSSKNVTYIRLAHFSVKEYLMSDRIAAGRAKSFSFTEADAHLHISHMSLAYHFHCINLLDQDTSDLELKDYSRILNRSGANYGQTT